MSRGEAVEGGEHFVEQADQVVWGHGRGEGSEPGDVREQHSDIGGTVGDRELARLQPLRDRGRKHVQQESLRAFPLGGDDLRGAVPLPDEVVQKEVAGSGDAEDVESEERDHDPSRDLRRLVRQEGIDRGRQGDDHEEGGEPACRLPATGDQQGAKRRRERPEDHATGWEETAQAELQDERQDQAQRQLPCPEEAVSLGLRENGQADDRDDLVGEGDCGGPVEAECPVRGDPDDRKGGDEARREDQGLLAERLVAGIRGQDPHPREPLDQAAPTARRRCLHTG